MKSYVAVAFAAVACLPAMSVSATSTPTCTASSEVVLNAKSPNGCTHYLSASPVASLFGDLSAQRCCIEQGNADFGTCFNADTRGCALSGKPGACNGLGSGICGQDTGRTCPLAGSVFDGSATLFCQVANTDCKTHGTCFGTVQCPGVCPTLSDGTQIVPGMTCIAKDGSTGLTVPSNPAPPDQKGYLTGEISICSSCSQIRPPDGPPISCYGGNRPQPNCPYTNDPVGMQSFSTAITEYGDQGNNYFALTINPTPAIDTYFYVAYRDPGFDHTEGNGVTHFFPGSYSAGGIFRISANFGAYQYGAQPGSQVDFPLISGTNLLQWDVYQAPCAGCSIAEYSLTIYTGYPPCRCKKVGAVQLDGFTLTIGGVPYQVVPTFDGANTYFYNVYIGTHVADGVDISFTPTGYTDGTRFRISYNFNPYEYDTPAGKAAHGTLKPGTNLIQIDVLQDPACGRDIAEYSVTINRQDPPQQPSRRLLSTKNTVTAPVTGPASIALVDAVSAPTKSCAYVRKDVSVSAIALSYTPAGGSSVALQLDSAFSPLIFHYVAVVATGAGALSLQLGDIPDGAKLTVRVNQSGAWQQVAADSTVTVQIPAKAKKSVGGTLVEVKVTAAACTGKRAHVYSFLLARATSNLKVGAAANVDKFKN